MNVYTTGVTECVAPDIQLRQDDFYQLMYCNREGGRVFAGGKWHKAASGNMYFIAPSETYAIEQQGNMRITVVKFIVDSVAVKMLLKEVPKVFLLSDDKKLFGIFQEVVDEALGGETYSNESTDAASLIFLVKLIRKFALNNEFKFALEHTPKGVDAIGNGYDGTMKKVMSYIEQHLSEPITLDDLSDYVYMNKSYFSKRFKDIWGVTPKRYINMMRIEMAKKLLLTTDINVADVAKKTGFASNYYFSRSFKQRENICPRKFREQNRK